MKRKDFLRNITLAFAAALLPKLLQPCSFDVEEMVDVPIQINWVVVDGVNTDKVKFDYSLEPTQWSLRMSKSEVDNFIKNTQS